MANTPPLLSLQCWKPSHHASWSFAPELIFTTYQACWLMTLADVLPNMSLSCLTAHPNLLSSSSTTALADFAQAHREHSPPWHPHAHAHAHSLPPPTSSPVSTWRNPSLVNLSCTTGQ
jgi:hypothetical protein